MNSYKIITVAIQCIDSSNYPYLGSVADCPVEGAVLTNCASPCPATCKDTGDRACITLCIQGCACQNGEVIDVENNRCVPREACPQST